MPGRLNSPPGPLAAAFLEVRKRTRGEVDPDLEATLSSRFERAARCWPSVHVEAAAWARYLGERVPEAEDLLTALARVETDDLYLACACAAGDAVALSVFDAELLPTVEGAVRRIGRSEEFVSEIQQRLRHRLFVQDDKERLRILDYTGQGALRNWLRAAAVRLALNLKKSVGREDALEDRFEQELVSPASDPELHAIKGQLRSEVKRALEEALRALSPEERNLLRLHLVDGLSIDKLGVLFQVHRSTTARRIERARQEVLRLTRERLMERAGVSPSDMNDVLNLVKSQLDVSISRYLRTPSPSNAST